MKDSVPINEYFRTERREKELDLRNRARGLKQTLTAIFEIHGTGYAYNTARGYGTPIGIGWMFTENLAITTHTVMANREIAKRCLARFPDNAHEVHQFAPGNFFYTNRNLNFTIIAVAVDTYNRRYPLDVKVAFEMELGDPITYHNADMRPKVVRFIDEDSFRFSANGFILPGMPLFTPNWTV